MEKQFNREDRLMKKLLNEAGERPSVDFKSNILSRIESRKVEIKPYKPLISNSVWFVLAGVMISSMIGLYFINSDVSFNYDFDYEIFGNINMPRIDLSQNMKYAVAFVALFFLQIPFLKRFIDREYQV
ncbi:MAG: hypothetical protein R3218_06085 [Christiangramia sp.]|nr:hypothetical protein [Christiangramia sp.]